MNPLVEWHVYLAAGVVTVVAVITAATIWIRARLKRARSQHSAE
jgi:hypothetical protein